MRVLLLLLLLTLAASADPTVRLPEQWRLATDDRMEYANPSFDDRKWQLIWVPSQLGAEGFQLPDGVVWFRATFDVPDQCVGKRMHIVLGKLDAADETYLNGERIGSMGGFPPGAKTAWSETRFYEAVLRKRNVIAIRLYHSGSLGGMTSTPFGLWSDEDFAREFHPPPGARSTFHQLVTGNGSVTAVYDFERDMVVSVLPQPYQAYDAKRFVQPFLRHLTTVPRRRPSGVRYVDNTHVIEVTYPDRSWIRYCACFTAPGQFCAQMSNPVRFSVPGARVGNLVFFGKGERPRDIIDRELAFMRKVHARARLPQGLSVAERAVVKQSITVLKMGQAKNGQLVACLPPGAFNVAWVRDGYYADMALNRLGLFPESRRWLDFQLKADSGHQASYVGKPYQISVARYFGNGREDAFSAGDSGPNIELDGFGLFLIELTDYMRRSGDRRFNLKRVERLVVEPLLNYLEPNGLVKADSGPWERYQDYKHFTYTSLVCGLGLRDWGRPEGERVLKAVRELLVTPGGWLKGNLEAAGGGEYDSHDGGTFEAFSMGLYPELWATQLAEYRRVLSVPGKGRGFARINEGDSYETAEWVLLDLRVASAMARMGDRASARRLLGWVTAQAHKNHDLIPEMYRRDNWAYDGAMPMVGFGAGAYVLALCDLLAGPPF